MHAVVTCCMHKDDPPGLFVQDATGGIDVAVANKGREAPEWLDRETFDVALLDVQMPEGDGFEATAEIRKREQATRPRLPLFAMTAYAMQGGRERCLAAGLDGYITKPIQSPRLHAALDQWVAAAGGPHHAPTPGGLTVL